LHPQPQSSSTQDAPRALWCVSTPRSPTCAAQIAASPHRLPLPSAGQKAALGGAALTARAPRRATRAPAASRHTTPARAAASRTISVPFAEELVTTARYISRPGRGILASDESNMTTGKRLASVGVDNTEENRRDWRQLLYTAPGLGAYISGAIMFEETLYQKAHDGTQFVDILKGEGILPGIKARRGGGDGAAGGGWLGRRRASRASSATLWRPHTFKIWPAILALSEPSLNKFDSRRTLPHRPPAHRPRQVDTGLAPLNDSGETATVGLDGLGERCVAYRAQGARFAKWRAVLTVTDERGPSTQAIMENAHGLARYAQLAQAAGLVPIVEPEVTLGPGSYSIEETAYWSERVNSHVMRALNEYGVLLEGILVSLVLVWCWFGGFGGGGGLGGGGWRRFGGGLVLGLSC
jgi:fructose-bisphosphate aldolase class 1